MSVDRIELIASLKSYAIQPIEADEHLVNAARKIIHKAVIQLLESEMNCHDEKNAEAFNQMRHATRRLSSLVLIANPDIHWQSTKRLSKRLEKLLSQLEDIYELTIMIRDLLHYGESMNYRMIVAGGVSQLDAQLLVARGRLLTYFKGKKYTETIVMLTDYLLNPIDDVFEPDVKLLRQPEKVKHVLPLILYEHLAQIRVFDTVIDENTPLSVYDELREQTTAFQSIIQSFESLLGANVTQYLDVLSDVNNNLNRLHDLNQMVNRLIHLPRATLTPGQVAALKQYRRNLRSRREKIGDDFPTCWENLHRKHNMKKFSEAILELL